MKNEETKLNKKLHIRGLRFIWLIAFIVLLWLSLVAISIPSFTAYNTDDIPNPGMLDPGSTTFGITIGAIILVAIIISNAVIRKKGQG